jgi:O-antigen/teichoic acid export membrane protein
VRKVLGYGLPFAPGALLAWGLTMGDRYIVARGLGPSSAGLYIAAYSLASRPFLMAESALCLFARPVLFQAESRRPGRAGRFFSLYAAVSAAVAAGGVLAFWLLGGVLVRLLLAEPYREGARPVLLWIASAHAVFMVAKVLELRLLSLKGSGHVALACAAGLAVNLGLCFRLVPSAGLPGAGAAKLAGFAAQLGVMTLALAMRRRGAGRPAGGPGTPPRRGEVAVAHPHPADGGSRPSSARERSAAAAPPFPAVRPHELEPSSREA